VAATRITRHNGLLVSGAAAVRRIWCEHVPWEHLDAGVLDHLAARGLRLVVAVAPRAEHLLPPLAERCASHGVPLSLWPLVDDRDGRWLGATNVRAYAGHLERVLDAGHGLPAGTEVVFDLEPPIEAARRLLGLKLPSARATRGVAPAQTTVAAVADLAAEVRRRRMSPTAVVAPMVLLDPPGTGGWQRLLGTPVDGVGFDRVAVMVYSSLIEGYGRGAMARPHATAMLSRLCELAAGRFGDRASVALGVVGGGALGDEQPYRAVEELREDVALARCAGVDDLSLYGLDGVLSRAEPAAQWLDAFVGTEAATRLQRPTWRVRAVLGAAALAGRAFASAARNP
jgi:hypothetical protein